MHHYHRKFATTVAAAVGSSAPSELRLDGVSERVDGALERNSVSNHNSLEGMKGNNTCKTSSKDFEEEPETRLQTLNDPARSSQEVVLISLQDFMARM